MNNPASNWYTDSRQVIKPCSVCKNEKGLDEFNNRDSASDGKRYECRECQRVASKKYNDNNKEAIAKRHSKYQKTDKGKEGHRKRNKKYIKTQKGKESVKRAGVKYGLTLIGNIRRKYYCMLQRCNDEDHPAFSRYGGKGIKCEFMSSQDFVNYVIDELGTEPRGKETHRIEVNGNYCRGNIEFLTTKEHIQKHKEL